MGSLVGCAEDVLAPDQQPSATDYRQPVVGVYSGRAFYRRSSFGITYDSVNWESDALVSLDLSDDSSIVISNADTVKLSPDLTFGGMANMPPPMNTFDHLGGSFQLLSDTMRLDFTGVRPLFELLDEYVYSGSMN